MSDASVETTFQSFPSPERSIARVCSLAWLLGNQRSSLSGLRVLELGCGSAGMLLSSAEVYPDARFVGLDRDQICIGRATGVQRALNLSNVTLLQGDLFEYRAEDPFDVVIVHGVYSWIPEAEREALLQKIQALLNPFHGVAYLSSNIRPGSFQRERLSRIASCVCSHYPTPAGSLKAVRSILQRWIDALDDSPSPQARTVQDEARALLKGSDAFLLQEVLNPDASAVFLDDLIQSAEASGLHYLCDAFPGRSKMEWGKLSDEPWSEMLNELGRKEASADLLFPEPFRGLVFSSVPPNREVARIRIPDSYLLCALVPVDEEPDIFSEKTVTFVSPTETVFEESSPILKGLLLYLRTSWPKPVSFGEAYRGALGLVGVADSGDQTHMVQQRIFSLFSHGVMEILRNELPIVPRCLEFPYVTRHARHEGRQQEWITTLRGETLPVDQIDRFILERCDGSTATTDILHQLQSAFLNKQFRVQVDGRWVEQVVRREQLIRETFMERLTRFAEQGIFMEKREQ